ncbi:hypothetical protein [Streptomyces sp. NPDC058280]|uniref:hypothetical protein n=1 Tax=Streptomyces sp. NPDC058280 TaxID=3346419 RepID=UPI0036E40773
MHRAYIETRQELEWLNRRLQEVAQAAGPVDEFETTLTASYMPEQEKAYVLRCVQDQDNRDAGRLRTEVVTKRRRADGSVCREAGLRDEMRADSTVTAA